MRKRQYSIRRAPEFRDWFNGQTEKAQVQIDARISKIQEEGYFGDQKCVVRGTDEIWELRWKNGRRLYFTHVPEKNILLLLGGNKNGQSKDIRKAKGLCQKYIT